MYEIATCYSSSLIFGLFVFFNLSISSGYEMILLCFQFTFTWWFLPLLIDHLYIFLDRISVYSLSTCISNIQIYMYVYIYFSLCPISLLVSNLLMRNVQLINFFYNGLWFLCLIKGPFLTQGHRDILLHFIINFRTLAFCLLSPSILHPIYFHINVRVSCDIGCDSTISVSLGRIDIWIILSRSMGMTSLSSYSDILSFLSVLLCSLIV